MGPAATAVTNDGRYAFVTFFLSEVVLKVRLADLTVEAKADLSQYFPLTSYHIVLDASERKVFVHSRSWKKILVLDTQAMSVIRTIDNIPAVGMIRSQHGGFLITWDNGNTVRFINTETYAVTEHTDPSIGFIQIRESPSDQGKWYVATQLGPGAPWTLGLYDHVTKGWIRTVTVPLQGTVPGIQALRVLPNERKAYVGLVNGWYLDNHAYGSVYSVDLATWQAKEIPVEGGALSLEVASDGRRLYVGTDHPAVPGDANNVQIVDVQSDTVSGAIHLGRSKYNAPFAELRGIQIDPANPRLLYAVSNDGNALVKIDVDSHIPVGVLVFNDETFRPHLFVKRSGQSDGYVLIHQSANTFELALDTATVIKAAALPGIRADAYAYDAAFTDAGKLLVAQGETFLEIEAATLSLVGTHSLSQGASLWRFVLSHDQRWIYSVVQDGPGYEPHVFLAIDRATFTVQARFTLDGGVFEERPFELPDGSKLYALGGFQNGAVTIHAIRTDNFTIQKTLTFQDTSLGPEGISAGPYYPYAYDASSRTLFVGAANVVLAIDTMNDTIKKVIYLRDVSAAIGVDLIYVNAMSLVYQPQENYLYMTHLDRAFVSVYDLTNNRFLSRVIPLKGYFPWFAFANDACSKIFVLNTRADNISVIDVSSKTEEKVIDLHEYLTVAPTIATHPTSRAVAAGWTVMFAVAATGTPAYQWQVSTNGGSTWSSLADASPYSGVTSMALTVTSAATALHGYQYRAVVTNSAGSATSNAATLRVSLPFTDDPLVAGSSVIRAVHITELRTRIDAVRTRFGLAAFSWTDPALTAGATTVRTQHIAELRAALAGAYVATGLALPTYTDPSLTAGATSMLVAHIAEIRAALVAIE